MIITFEELNNKRYEIQTERSDEIFNELKKDLKNMFEKYKDNEKEFFTAFLSIGCLVEKLNQAYSDEYGAKKIIDMVGAKEIIEDEHICTGELPY